MGCDSKRRNTWSFLTKLDSREEAQVDAETQSRSLLGLMPSLHLPSRARVAVEVITPVGSGAKGATVPASPAGHTLVGDPGATQPGLRLPTLRRCVTEACFTLQGWKALRCLAVKSRVGVLFFTVTKCGRHGFIQFRRLEGTTLASV